MSKLVADQDAASSSPSPRVGEGRGGGSGDCATAVPRGTTPTPDPSPAEPRCGEDSVNQQSDRSRQEPTSVGGREKSLTRGGVVEGLSKPLLSVEGVSLSFGGVRALTDVSFDIAAGEIRAIIGPNGAGKTSMLNVINGFY